MVFRIFGKKLEKFGRETGFIKRKSKLKARDFLILMSFGQLAMRFPSLAGMVDALKLKISREALHQRFNQGAVNFLQSCLAFLLKQKIKGFLDLSIFKPFNRVILWDSSNWDIKPGLQSSFQGFGGSGSKANFKLQLAYELKQGLFYDFDLQPGIFSDVKYSHELPDKLDKNDLLIADMGYFTNNLLKDLSNQGSFYLFRLVTNRTTLDADSHEEIDLRKVLKKVKANYHEQSIALNLSKSVLNCRLVCLRVPKEIANQRRRKYKELARRKRNHEPLQKKLDLCGWTLLITNIPKEKMPTEKVYLTYRLRWQIELVIKQFKSILQIHKGSNANKHRFLCEIYGKLIAAVLIQKVYSLINRKYWNSFRQELSFDKFWKRFQERSFIFIILIQQNLKLAIKLLKKEVKLLHKNLRKLTQNSKTSSLQALLFSHFT